MSEKRIGFLDTWRAAALLAMIVWHFLFDLASAGLVPDSLMQSGVMELARYAIAGSFIVISGVCARLSKRPLRRGLIVFGAALLVSAATYLFGTPVYWGILHLLGACMLLYAAVRKRWDALPGTYACGAAVLVFALTFALPIRVRVSVPFLFPLGLRTAAFASADYYPLLPWGALFFAAAAAAERLDDMPPEKKYRCAPRALAWLSRRSLAVYLVHQPVLFGMVYLMKMLCPSVQY